MSTDWSQLQWEGESKLHGSETVGMQLSGTTGMEAGVWVTVKSTQVGDWTDRITHLYSKYKEMVHSFKRFHGYPLIEQESHTYYEIRFI